MAKIEELQLRFEEIKKQYYNDEMQYTIEGIAKNFNSSPAMIRKILKVNNCKRRLKPNWIDKNALSLNIDYFKEIDTHEKAYWLGYLTADGSILDTHRVSLVSKDYEVIENFKQAVESKHKIVKNNHFDKRINKRTLSYQISIRSKIFTRHVINKGVTNKKSFYCELPKINPDLMSSYIRGLFDGDGSISLKRKTKHILIRVNLSSTFSILKNILKILNLNNAKVFKIENKSGYDLHKIYLYKDAITFLNYIYQYSTEKTRLTRKYNLYLEGKSTVYKKEVFKCKHCNGTNTRKYGFNRTKKEPRQIIYCVDCNKNFIYELKKAKPLIFLDLDGVMVPFNNISNRIDIDDVLDFYLFDKKCVKVLNEIIELTDCDIIISSDWKYHYTLNQLRKIFKYNGITKEPFGVTIEKGHNTLQTLEPDRCFEIEDAVKKLKPEKWCSVDDLELFDLGKDHFVYCSQPYKEGIKQSNVKEKIIKRLI